MLKLRAAHKPKTQIWLDGYEQKNLLLKTFNTSEVVSHHPRFENKI